MSSTERHVLSRDTDLSKVCRVFKLDIPGTVYTVHVRELGLDEFDNLPKNLPEQLALMIVDENGQLQYTTPEDVERLKKLSLGVMRFIVTEVARLHGASPDAIEAAIKNYKPTPSADSVSA